MTKRSPDADLKKAARALMRELEAWPEDTWELVKMPAADRKVFMLLLRDLAERGSEALKGWRKAPL